MTVRYQRIDLLLNPGSFREMGSLAGSVEYNETGDQLTSFVASNNIIGSGTITHGSLSKKVMVLADDFSGRFEIRYSRMVLTLTDWARQ